MRNEFDVFDFQALLIFSAFLWVKLFLAMNFLSDPCQTWPAVTELGSFQVVYDKQLIGLFFRSKNSSEKEIK